MLTTISIYSFLLCKKDNPFFSLFIFFILKIIAPSKKSVIIKLIVDEKGQGAAEYILLFGGVIVIALIALQIYSSYFSNENIFSAKEDAQQIRANLTNKT